MTATCRPTRWPGASTTRCTTSCCRLPDATRVFPAHGAGSSCGRQLSTETSSTLGEQRQANYALQPMGEDEFVAAVTEGQPVRPHYFEFDAQRNRELRPLLDEQAPAAARHRRRPGSATQRGRCCSTPASPPTSPPGTCVAR